MLLNKFVNRYRVSGELRLETALHIGAGDSVIDPTANDNPVIRDKDGKPFIPGSSFKGVWRTMAEKLLANGWGKQQTASQPCMIVHKSCISIDEAKELKNKYKDEQLAEALYEKMCPVCRIFGCNQFSSRVKITDLKLHSNWPGGYEVRPGVSIDRDTRTAMYGRTYETESVQADTRFTFEVIVDNVDDDQWYDTLLTLMPFARGEVLMGGSVSRGYGRVKLEELNVQKLDKENIVQFLTSSTGWENIGSVSWQEETSRIFGN